MGSRESEPEVVLNSIGELEGYFDIDEDYRGSRVKNNAVLEQVKKTFGL